LKQSSRIGRSLHETRQNAGAFKTHPEVRPCSLSITHKSRSIQFSSGCRGNIYPLLKPCLRKTRNSDLGTDDDFATPLRRSTRGSTAASTASSFDYSENGSANGSANGTAVKKRGVGRPRKSKLVDELDVEGEEDTQSESKSVSQTQEVVDVGASPKRSRGRPRKVPVDVKEEEHVDIKMENDVIVKGDDLVKPSYKIDSSGEYEFGGPFGVTAMMVGFPILMWYMWLGATYYDGQFPLPKEGQEFSEFAREAVHLVYNGAFPHAQAWLIYWTFFVTEGLFYLYMPGVYAEGKPLPHLNGHKLLYYCSGVWSFYSTIVIMGALHVTVLFRLPTLIDEFGPLMTVAIITGYIVSIVAYFSAKFRGAEHRMTGNFLYDFFMGAELNPRLLGWLDFKMFFEVRLPWFILFFVSLAAAVRQYETYGYVSGEVAFVLMAHFLYANACCKGEELITTSWLVPLFPFC
jgi:Ergosterol biosynthesis ERG4/ERG24 family